jgi:hypothetical protein
MFDLRKDLKVYTSKAYDEVRRIIDSARRDGTDYVYQAAATVQTVADYRGAASAQIKVQGADFLREKGVYMEWGNVLLWNPTLNLTQLQAGAQIDIRVPEASVAQWLENVRPDTSVNRLCLSPTSVLAEALGAGGGRRSRVTKADTIVRAWVAHVVELGTSKDKEDLTRAAAGLPGTDFGLRTVEQIESVVRTIAALDGQYESKDPERLLKAVQNIDGFIAKNGGTPIKRSKPRARAMRAVYEALYEGKPIPKDLPADDGAGK